MENKKMDQKTRNKKHAEYLRRVRHEQPEKDKQWRISAYKKFLERNGFKVTPVLSDCMEGNRES